MASPRATARWNFRPSVSTATTAAPCFGFGIEVELKISLPGMGREAAEDLISKAHIVCPYSNATRNNIDVKLKLV